MLNRQNWVNLILEGSTGSFLDHGKDIQLSLGELKEEDLHVAGFYGHEAMNELYSLDVVFSSDSADSTKVMEALGKDTCLRLPYPNGDRLIIGVAASIELVEPRNESLVWHMELVPRLWSLSKTRVSRVYQDLTTKDIVEEVLKRHKVPHRFGLSGTYPKREYCLQYEESDLDFVLRLLADEGYVFTFDHFDEDGAKKEGFDKKQTEALLIGDDPTFYVPVPKDPEPAFHYRPDAAQSADRGGWAMKEPIVRFVTRNAMGTNRVAHRDFDFLRAAPTPGSANPTSTSTTIGPMVQNGAVSLVRRTDDKANVEDLEVYEHRAYEPKRREEQKRADIHLEQLRRNTAIVTGSSWCRRLIPGKYFKLIDYPATDPGEIALTRVVHSSHPEPGRPEIRYVNDFEGVKKATLYRPDHPPRRFIQSVETATVVGTPGQDVDTEQYGRIKVQFHWDRMEKNDDHSSIWIRVAQPWSGPTFGFQFIPRIGAEVVVAFVGGNPDHPLVVASLPNLANQLPHVLPQNSTTSAIRSCSMPATGGYNEVMFDDAAGNELLSLRAERNHEIVVLKDHRLDVGKDSTTKVSGSRITRVSAEDDLEVTGNARRRVGANLSDFIGGNRQESVGKSAELNITGNQVINVGGVVNQTIAKNFRMIVGGEEKAEAFTQVNGEYHIAASKFLDLESAEKLRIVVGTSAIELTPKGIRVEAEKVEFVVKEEIKTKSKKVSVMTKDLTEIQGKKITLTSKSASLVMETNAALDGKKVLLNCGGIEPKEIKDDEPPKKGKVTFRVDPPPGLKGPFTVIISTPTGERVEMKTDGDNKVELEGDENDDFTLIEVRKGSRILQQHGDGKK